METLNEIYNQIYNSTYCINPLTIPPYINFMVPLLDKYLNDESTEYTIYISAPNKILPKYQNLLPHTNRIKYEGYGFIPSEIPDNINAVYLYHNTAKKPTSDEQMLLVDFMQTRPTLKYVYIGNASILLPIVRVNLFKYYLHFETQKRRWGCIRSGGIGNSSARRTICRKYFNQLEKKKVAVNPMNIYDFFLFHDLHLEVSRIVRFNKTVFKPKIRRQSTQRNQNANNAKPKIIKEVEIKYIYTGTRNSKSALTMPDGSTENFDKIVKRYDKIIVV